MVLAAPNFDDLSTTDAINLAIAVATFAAALVAARAARHARRAAEASEAQITLEQERDQRRVDREVRSVVVDAFIRVEELGDLTVTRFWVRVLNGTSTPITHCRIEVETADDRWGPNLVGSIPPGACAVVGGAIRGEPKADHAVARARYTLPGLGAWTVNAKSEYEPDDDLEAWIARGAEHSQRDLQAWEEGIALLPVPADEPFPPSMDRLNNLFAGNVTPIPKGDTSAVD